MNKQLEKSIIKTLAFFDCFKHPLTKEELFRFLWQPPKIEYTSFLFELDNIDLNNNIDYKYGFYFLKGNEQNVEKRRERTYFVDHKINIAKKTARKFRFVPFIKAFFVCNNVSFDTVDDLGDVDIFLVVKRKRIWTVMTLATLMLRIFGLRPTEKRVANKICLTFYADEDSLDLSKIAITNPDIYLIYWLAQLASVNDRGGITKILKDKNLWLKQYLPNLFVDDINEIDHIMQIQENRLTKIWKGFWERAWGGGYGDFLEGQFKKIKLMRMRLKIKILGKELDSRVILSDNMLKFHENDRRMEYKERWKDRKLLVQ